MRAVRFFSKHTNIACAAWIALCFTLTSGVYLSWVYRLLALADGAAADWCSMVAGYLLQAAGVALAACYLRRGDGKDARRAFIVLLAAFTAVSLPALLSGFTAGAVIFGLLMNLLCGGIAGFYLYALALRAEPARRGIVFGGGYAAATVSVWLLSLIGQRSFLSSRAVLAVYAALGIGAALSLRLPLLAAPDAAPAAQPERFPAKNLALAATAVFLISLVKNLGFSFPSEDIGAGNQLELSRLFYAVGLAAAGFISDRSRKNGAVCTAAALAIPFILLALAGEPVSSFIFWSLDYLFFGFFSVFRAALFVDIACRTRRWELAPLGLLAGRVGDAAGTAVCLLLSAHRIALIAVTAALFLPAMFLFFRLYQAVYEPEAARQRSEREVFEAFSIQHDLSAREREVLRLVLAERSNAEIADALFVSESTVKYHVHNLLKKTGCKGRMELIAKYAAAMYPALGNAS